MGFCSSVAPRNGIAPEYLRQDTARPQARLVPRRQMLAATKAAKSAAYESATCRSRNALATTLTDDNAMAAAPIVGDSNSPNSG